jgi:hypothetical protein
MIENFSNIEKLLQESSELEEIWRGDVPLSILNIFQVQSDQLILLLWDSEKILVKYSQNDGEFLKHLTRKLLSEASEQKMFRWRIVPLLLLSIIPFGSTPLKFIWKEFEEHLLIIQMIENFSNIGELLPETCKLKETWKGVAPLSILNILRVQRDQLTLLLSDLESFLSNMIKINSLLRPQMRFVAGNMRKQRVLRGTSSLKFDVSTDIKLIGHSNKCPLQNHQRDQTRRNSDGHWASESLMRGDDEMEDY